MTVVFFFAETGIVSGAKDADRESTLDETTVPWPCPCGSLLLRAVFVPPQGIDL